MLAVPVWLLLRPFIAEWVAEHPTLADWQRKLMQTVMTYEDSACASSKTADRPRRT